MEEARSLTRDAAGQSSAPVSCTEGVQNSIAGLKSQRRPGGLVRLTAIVPVLQCNRSFGIDHAFGRLAAKSTGENMASAKKAAKSAKHLRKARKPEEQKPLTKLSAPTDTPTESIGLNFTKIATR